MGQYIGKWLNPETEDPILEITHKLDSLFHVKQYIDDFLYVSTQAQGTSDSLFGEFTRKNKGKVSMNMTGTDGGGQICVRYPDTTLVVELVREEEP